MKKLITILLLALSNSAFAYSYSIYCTSSYYVESGWVVNCFVSEVDCSWHPSAVFCRDYSAIKLNPTIFTNTNGAAVLDDGGKIIRIESDGLKDFYSKNKILLNTNQISKEAFDTNLKLFLKKDDGKISKERLQTIAKDLDAKIVLVDKLPVANYCPGCQIADANNKKQTPNTSFDQKTGDKSLLLNIGGGITNPSSVLQDNANLGNLSQFNINAFVPISSFGGATGGIVNFGINAGGEYFIGNKDYSNNAFAPYQISNQSSSPTVVAKGSGSPKQQGFKTEAGIQANISVGKLVVSPILNASYFSLKQKAFNITQTSAVNGQTYNYRLYNQAETKTTGFAFIPKLRVSYFPGRLGFYVEGNYTFGPTIKNETSTFKPQGVASAKDGTYAIDQMITGTFVAQTKSNKFNSAGVNIGVSFYLSKKGYDSYKAKGDMASADSNTNPYYQSNSNVGQNPANSVIGAGSISGIAGGAVAGKAVNPVYEDNGSDKTNPMATTKRRVEVLKSNKTGEPNAQKIADNPLYNGSGSTGTNPMHQSFVAGTPIGGIIVKGGKNAGPNTFNLISNNNGEVEFNVSELGNYKFILTASATVESKARKAARKAAKKARASHAVVQNPLYEGAVSTGNNPLYQGFTAGNPIGGIIIKGGKNSGGQMFTVTSNEKGEIELNNLTPGNYKFTLTAPESTKQDTRTYTGGRKN